MSASTIARFVESLERHPVLGRMVVHRERLPGRPERRAAPTTALHPDLAHALASRGIAGLWSHQAAGLDAARAGRNVLVATPTASGKTLLFASALLETIREEPGARAVVIYPTKALARDQLAGFRDLAGGLGALAPPRFEIYDGDTPAHRRARIRADPPDVLITNPDMLHRGILAHHGEWEPFLSRLRWVVLDELHVYRGLFGAHVHHVLARLRRLARAAGGAPGFVAASATVGNPAEFARTLVGEPFEVVDDSGAPQPPRDVLFVNPAGVSPYTITVRLLAEACDAGLRTIAFTKARRVTELVHQWLLRQRGDLAGRVAPYRSGYLAEERRRIEARLFGGDLSAVVATSALELGIDVGGLDVCILVGYPGSLVSAWQRIGRVGRRGREGLAILVAMPDALDQYLMRHPQRFFSGEFEQAILDPGNPFVAGSHLVCAAAERPLERDELGGDGGERLAADLVREGRLVEDAAGERYYAFRRRPHRDVNPRSAGSPYTIVDGASGRPLGSIDGLRVWHECHPGAVYLHAGDTWVVGSIDEERRSVTARRRRVDHYTVPLGDKETRILARLDAGRVGPFPVGLGRLEVTVRIREYQKKRLFDGETIATHPLDAPPLTFETVGLWIELPPGLPQAFAGRDLHFMGGIHAAEHATIGLLPLVAIADRGDVGGISYTGHPQTGGPAIFLYDGVPGGAGLAARAFRELDDLVRRTRDLVRDCPCDAGCPACIHSPKCGNGNKPLDKGAAIAVLDLLAGDAGLEDWGVDAAGDEPADGRAALPVPDAAAAGADAPRKHGVRRRGNLDPAAAATARRGAEEPPAAAGTAPVGAAPAPRVLVFDLETQRGADEVGGWGHVDRMGLALAVVYDVAAGSYRTYLERDVDRLLLDLAMADRVVGFNVDRFDLPVLAPYTEQDLGRIRTLDMLAEIHRTLGFRISLGHLAEVNLGVPKSASGLESLRWWKQGRVDLIEAYCRKDVELTWRLWQLGSERGYLLYRDHQRRTVRVPVAW